LPEPAPQGQLTAY
nr:Chain C, LPEP peptide from EBV, P5A, LPEPAPQGQLTAY [synthetic construct]